MAYTKILFKQGNSAPTSVLNGSIGEPLWCTSTNQLYVTNGDTNSAPTLIGPINNSYSHPTFTIPTGSNYTVTAGTDAGDQVVAASTGYAIGGFTVTSEGHIKAVTAVSAGVVIENVMFDGTTGTAIVTINGTTIYAPTAGASTGRNDELTAEENNTTTPDGTVALRTALGSRTVTLRHTAQTNSAGTYATFAVSDNGSAGDKYVTMTITEINGGTW